MDTELVRPPAVAGMFYPSDPDELSRAVVGYLDAASTDGPTPKAIIAPHAGYIYSGPVAASAYVLFRGASARIRRVVLVGPAHRAYVQGLALAAAERFATPLGEVPVDRNAISKLMEFPQVSVQDDAHAQEHSLEVHLPFLQVVLGEFSLVPLVAGRASEQEVAEVLDTLWEGDETLIVISSDLSHYHSYEEARRLDSATSRSIEFLRSEDIDSEHACGCVPVAGLLAVARQRGLTARVLDLRNSGDTAGPRGEVVGYGAYAFA